MRKIELHERSNDGEGTALYEVTIDGLPLLGIVMSEPRFAIDVLTWNEDGEARTILETDFHSIYDPAEENE